MDFLKLLQEWGIGADTLLLIIIVWRLSQMASRFKVLEKTVEEHSKEIWGNGHQGIKADVLQLKAEHCLNHGHH